MYSTHNTTIICKDILKELDGKWFSKEQGWIFVGIMDNDESLESNSKFLTEKLNEQYEVEIKYSYE